MNWFIPACFLFLAAFSSVLPFSWENCGPATNPVKVEELEVRRKGDIFYISTKSKITENLTEPIEAKLKIRKKIPFSNDYFDIPCINNMGSCDYKDICKLSPWQKKPCPADFVKDNIPCKCPIQQNHYEAKELALNFGHFPPEIRGTYKAKLMLYKNGAELLCLKMKMKI